MTERMADTSGTPPKQFRVQKDNGEWWTMTFGGGRRGVRWDREDPIVHPDARDDSHKHAASTPGNTRFSEEWSEYVAERLMQALKEMLEETRPYIEEWLVSNALPWIQRTAKSAWIRVTSKKRSRQPSQFVTPAEVQITHVAPASAVIMAERIDEQAQPPSSLTPEEVQKQLEDIAPLTTILAAKVRALTNSVIRENGDSDKGFLDRRKQAEHVAVRNVTRNIQLMLEQGTDLGQVLALSATYVPAFAAGRVETGQLSIESPSKPQQEFGL